MPQSGSLSHQPGTESDPVSGYRSRFHHESEFSAPGFYKVFLEDYGIDVELTATERCGFHKYTFPDNDSSFVLLDLKESVTSDKIINLELQILSSTEVSGMRRTAGWANDQIIYFYAEFSEPFIDRGIILDDSIWIIDSGAKGENIKAFFKFNTDKNRELLMKVGLSAVRWEAARMNLQEEISGWNFRKIKNAARSKWQKELSRIVVEDPDESKKRIFYTAFYHSLLAPNLYSDVDGKFRDHNLNIQENPGHNIYTVFSLWDTYRAAHPLFNIIQPERNLEFVKTMLRIYEDSGLLPVWELAANETNCMIGYHAVPVIVDAYKKGIRDFDHELAFEAMKASAESGLFGLDYYTTYGYIPADMEGESVSKTLEYAYDDWCIAQFARELDKMDDYSTYIRRAQSYKNLFDPQTNFIRGKRNGAFVEPFDPAEVNFMLTEANTWQYTFYVPQDIKGLINLMGGEAEFEMKLDKMFSSDTDLSGRHQADITGLIGQYAHGNEPSHHMAYLYSFIGEPFKTQKVARRIMKDLYSDQPEGLCGNEDCGQMSAWYVFSSIGFYPVTPGMDYYVIGSPVFNKVTVHLDNGNKIVIEANNNSAENIYINTATYNDRLFNHSYISHKDIMAGGRLIFEMSPRPNKDWGSEPEYRPVSEISDNLITPVPYFSSAQRTFKKDLALAIGHVDSTTEMRYTINAGHPDNRSAIFKDSIFLNHSSKIKAIAISPEEEGSSVTTAEYLRLVHEYSIQIKNPYSTQYSAGGDIALIDLIRGTNNFRTGAWQGYHGVDMEVIVDIGQTIKINSLGASFLEDQNSWIFKPAEVIFQISDRPYDFKTLAIIQNDDPEPADNPEIYIYAKSGINSTTRYVKIIAKNIAVCPAWHKGSGSKAWIFADEILIN